MVPIFEKTGPYRDHFDVGTTVGHTDNANHACQICALGGESSFKKLSYPISCIMVGVGPLCCSGGGVPSFVIAASGVVVVGLGGPPSLGSMAGSHSPLQGVHSKSSTIVISVGID